MLNREIISGTQEILKRYVSDFRRFNLDTYSQNKKNLFDDFGEELILTKEVNIELSKEYKETEMKNYVRNKLHPGLSDLVLQNGADGFFENKITKDLQLIGYDGREITIKAGMRLSRAFRYFIESGYSLERNQTEYSKISNSPLSGNLSLSIHPYDYLSMSMSGPAGWGSCQSLDGDYAAGTLGLMNDTSTIIAYLHNGENYSTVFPRSDISWNSKKWRVLVHISKDRDLILFSKQYPFTSNELLQAVLDMIKEVYPNKNFTACEPATDEILRNGFEKDYESPHYGDLRSTVSSCTFKPYMAASGRFELNKIEPIIIGNPVSCCKCDSDIIHESSEFCCNDCSENRYCCDCCGECGFHEDNIFWMENESYCERCYDENFSNCDNCGDSVYNDDMMFFEPTDNYYCESCYSDISLEYEEEEEEEV